jgi:hypothetical protein
MQLKNRGWIAKRGLAKGSAERHSLAQLLGVARFMASGGGLQTKILSRAKSPDDYAIYRAALEWGLTDAIVIESRDDFKSEFRWKDRLEPFHHQVQNLITFCRRLPVTLLADDVGLGKTISAGLVASELIARNRVSKILIVAPKLLGPQWKDELEAKFDIPGEVITGSKARIGGARRGRCCHYDIPLGPRPSRQNSRRPLRHAGTGIELVARTVEATEISKIVRQSDPQLRLVVEQLARGDVGTALETMAGRDCVIEANGQAATIKAAVDHFLGQRAAAPEKLHLLICKTNATRLALDSEVRRRLRTEGVLTGEDVRIDAVPPSGRAYRLSLAEGDRIRFGIRCEIGHHSVINGTVGTISDIVAEEDGHSLIAARVDGRELLFSSREVVDGTGRVRLSTDYTSTIWSSQGLTSHSATIVTDTAFDRRDIYVALSRAKQQSTLCVDSRALNFAIRAETGFDRSADEIAVEERREHLVRQMSRWRTKTSGPHQGRARTCQIAVVASHTDRPRVARTVRSHDARELYLWIDSVPQGLSAIPHRRG